MTTSSLSTLVRDRRWSEPPKFAASDAGDMERLGRMVASGAVKAVVDPVSELADELYELHRIGAPSDGTAQRSFKSRFMAEADTFGVWIFFPWSGELVRYPDKLLHRELRTFRNRNLITVGEQSVLSEARVAVLGLSVGSNVVDQFVQTGIGAA